jgi:hypothetical protein
MKYPILLCATALLPVCAFAQVARPAPETAPVKPVATAVAPSSKPEEVIELSPFTVNAGEESGYYAEKGLSSGRLGVDLKDSAANVNVFTKELALDLGAIDLGSLLEFSNSTQLDQADFTGSLIDAVLGEGTGRANISGRARGLPTIRLVDYEVVDWEIDTYNIDRTDVYLGTDAILFGNGSSGGTFNFTRDLATLRRNRTVLSYNVGSYGRRRAIFDSNYVIVPNKLALRVSLLDYSTEGRRMWDYADRRASSLAATFRPHRNTTFRVSYDSGQNQRHQPLVNNLPENRVSQWLASTAPDKFLSPTQSTFTGSPVQATINANLILAGLEQVQINGGRIFQDPATGLLPTLPTGASSSIGTYFFGSPRAPGVTPFITGVGALSPTTPATTNPTRLTYFRPRAAGTIVGTTDGTFTGAGGVVIGTQVLPTSIFDYDNISYAGPDSRYQQDYQDFRINFEQQLAKDLHFRTYLRRSHSDQNSQFIRRNGINPAVYVDPYSAGPNDPYTGMYHSYVQWRQQTAEDKRRAWVSNLAWRKDLGPYFGKHNLSLGYDERRDESEILTYNERVYTPSLDGTGVYSVVLARVNYFDPKDNTTHNAGKVSPIAPFTLTDQFTGLTAQGRVGFLPQGTGDAPGSRHVLTDRTSKIFSLQSFWLNDRVITSYGVREDSTKSVTRLPTYYPAGSPVPPYNGLAFSTLDYNGYAEPDPLTGRFSSNYRATAWSVVAHLDKAKNYSVFYNNSGNSSDPIAQRILPDSVAPTSASKTTSEEYGVRLSFLDGKIETRFSRYEALQSNNYLSGFQVNGGFWARFTRAGGANFANPAQAPLRIFIENPDGTVSAETYSAVANGSATFALDQWLNLISANNLITPAEKATYERVLGISPDFFNANEKNTGVQAVEDNGGSDGYEAHITLKPTKNIDVILNYSYVNFGSRDTAGDASEWLDTFYDQVTRLPASVLDARFDTDTLRPTRPGPFNAAGVQTNIPLTPFDNNITVSEGRPATGYTNRVVFAGTYETLRQALDELIQERSAGYGNRKHNFNVTTRYTFREGKLKGLSLGAGYTYRSDSVIATLRLPENGTIVSRTVRGDSLWNSRAFFNYRFAPKLFGKKHNITLAAQIENLLQNKLERVPLRLKTTIITNRTIGGTTRTLTRDINGDIIPTNFSYRLPREYNFTATLEF